MPPTSITRATTSGRGLATMTSAARHSSGASAVAPNSLPRRPSAGTWRRSTAAASASPAASNKNVIVVVRVQQRQLQRELARELRTEPGDLDERDAAAELEPRAHERAIGRAGLGERALADRTDDQDPIAFDARILQRHRREVVDSDEAIGVGLRPRGRRIEIADDRDHGRRIHHLIARDGQRERRMRIEDHRRIGRAQLELPAQLALGPLAEQRAPHAVRHADALARPADVDRAHAQPGRLDRGEHGHDRRRRRAGAGHHEDGRVSHGARPPG